MSAPEFPQQTAGNGPQVKKSNAWIIILIVAAVLAVPALCLCGGVVARWALVSVEPRKPPADWDSPTRSPVLLPTEPDEPPPVVDERQPAVERPEPAADEPEAGTIVPAREEGVLYTLEPFTTDKANMPGNTRAFLVSNEEGKPSTYSVTLLQFYPDRDPRLHKEDKLIAYATGFTMDANVPWPTTGAVSFRFLGVGGPETTISVSVDKKPVWNYHGGPQESVASPPVVLAGDQNETKNFDLSLTVGGGARNPTGGIQLFTVIASEKDVPEHTAVPPVPTSEEEPTADDN
jgi:hypothetical protein